MANKYCNLVGSNKIKDEYGIINTGFAAVQVEVEALEVLEGNHVTGVLQRHTSSNIDNVSTVTGITVTSALDALKALIDNLGSVYSTDIERINAINQALADAFGADSSLQASVLGVIATVQAEITAHKNTDAITHPSSKITFDKTGSNLVATIVETAIKELNTKVENNKTNGDANLISHQNSSSAHGSSSITNQSSIAGAKVTDVLNALKDSLASIVANVTVDSEVILARSSGIKNTSYSTLDDRLEAIENTIEVSLLDIKSDFINHAVYQELMDTNGYNLTDNTDDSLLGRTLFADIGDITGLQKNVYDLTILISSITSSIINISASISRLNNYALLDNTF